MFILLTPSERYLSFILYLTFLVADFCACFMQTVISTLKLRSDLEFETAKPQLFLRSIAPIDS